MLTFKNAQIFVQNKLIKADLSTESGKIVHIKKNIKSGEKIDCSGKIILPGLIDPHVHFRTPGEEFKEDWVSGSKAAVAGGITTVFDMPNNKPPVVTVKNLNEKKKTVLKKSLTNFGLFFAVNNKNFDEIKKAQNIAGLKLYMGESTGKINVDSKYFEKIFSFASNQNILLALHAENQNIIDANIEKAKQKTQNPELHSFIRNSEAELEAVKKSLQLHGSNKMHFCHMSSESGVNFLQKNKNSLISCEVSPHHLFLSEKNYKKLGNLCKINPALKSEKDRLFLLNSLKNEHINIIASDHAPHTLEEKEKDYWNAPAGIPGVETMLPLMLDAVNKNLIELKTVVNAMSKNIVKIFGLHNKGLIKEGFDADLTIIDLKKEWIVKSDKMHSKAGWTPFEGWKLKGKPVLTVVNGIIKFNNNNVVSNVPAQEVLF